MTKYKYVMFLFLTIVISSCKSKVDLNGAIVDNNQRAPNVNLILVDSQTHEEITRAKSDVNGEFVFSSIPKGDYIIVAQDPLGSGLYTSQIREFKKKDYLLKSDEIDYDIDVFKKFFINERLIDSIKNLERNPDNLIKVSRLNSTQDSMMGDFFNGEKIHYWHWSDPLMYFTTYHFIQVKDKDQNNITIDIDISHLY